MSTLTGVSPHVRNIAAAALSHLSIEYLLPDLLQSLQTALAMETATVWLLGDDGTTLVERAAIGTPEANSLGADRPVEKSPSPRHSYTDDSLPDHLSLDHLSANDSSPGFDVPGRNRLASVFNVGRPVERADAGTGADGFSSTSRMNTSETYKSRTNEPLRFCDLVFERKRTVIVEDLSSASHRPPAWGQGRIASLLGLPLLREGRLIGVVELGSYTPRHITPEEVELAQWSAGLFVHAIEHALRFEDVRKSEALKSAMFETSLDGIVVLDEEGRIIEYNHVASQIFGSPRSQVLYRHFHELFLPANGRQRHGRALRRYLKTGSDTLSGRCLRVEAQRADGSGFPLEFTLTTLEALQPIQYLAIVRDVSGEKQAQAQCQAALSESQEAHAKREIAEAKRETAEAKRQAAESKRKETEAKRRQAEAKRREAEAECEDAQVVAQTSLEQLRALHAHLATAIEDERAHIARELHDEFGQSLASLQIALFSLTNWVDGHWNRATYRQGVESSSLEIVSPGTEPSSAVSASSEAISSPVVPRPIASDDTGSPALASAPTPMPQDPAAMIPSAAPSFSDIPVAEHEELWRRTGEINHLLSELHGMVRRIATELRPSVLDDLGLEAAVEWQLGEFEEKTGLSYRLAVSLGEEPVEPMRATALFRILQEGLTNVARHAEADHVTVELFEEEDRLQLSLHDDGCGIADTGMTNTASLGILGMRERARLLGGDTTIAKVPSGGTRLDVWIPARPTIPTRPSP